RPFEVRDLTRSFFQMDIDPLADAGPPRHAIESDEEEDEYNPLQHTKSHPRKIEIQILGVSERLSDGLVIAQGTLAKYWARAADLREQVGAVMVNGIQVGLLFRPSWTRTTVLVSEVTTQLPIWAMNQYAASILDQLQPRKLALLDIYVEPMYVSQKRLAYPDANLRYLCTETAAEWMISAADLFSPPNLVQSTSASFVAQQAQRGLSATLLLVPAPHVQLAPPRDLIESHFSHWDEDGDPWNPILVSRAHELLFRSLDVDCQPWNAPGAVKPSAKRRRPTDSESGMYI
ncbi:unnamed protein product, partial [Mycena citricolor]